MRTILAAILCSSLLIGGSSTAAEAEAVEIRTQVPAAGSFFGKLIPGQTDFNAFLERLSEGGCPTTPTLSMTGPGSVTTNAACLGFQGDHFVILPYRSRSGQSIVRAAAILFNKDDLMFKVYAEDLQKQYGAPESRISSLDGSVRTIWRKGDLELHLVKPSTDNFGYVVFASVALEAEIANGLRAAANADAAGG